MGIWSGIEMPWKNRRRKEVVMFIEDGSDSISRYSHFGNSLDTNISHLRSLDNQLSIPISRTIGAYNDVSFWQVKVYTRSSQIARWLMRACTTSGGNDPTSTRYSRWWFMRSRKQWVCVITRHSIKVKKSSWDWKNCWTYHSMSSKSLSYLDTMTRTRTATRCSLILRYITDIQRSPLPFRCTSWMMRIIYNPHPSTSCTSRTCQNSNNVSLVRVTRRIEISPGTRRAGSETSSIHIQLSKTMKYRYIEIR